MKTISELAHLIGVDRWTIKKWGAEFSEYLSASANPRKGEQRQYTEKDIRVLALIYMYWEDEPDYEDIRMLLNSETYNEREYVDFAYMNMPLFQELPDEIDETWTHGLILDSRLLGYEHIEVARAYKYSGDILLDKALAGNELQELKDPILFSYRHAIELYLKFIVGYEYDPRDRDAHYISKLVKSLKDKYGKDLPKWANDLLDTFHEADPKGTAFRYPGQLPSTILEYWVDFRQLRMLMNHLFEGFEELVRNNYSRS